MYTAVITSIVLWAATGLGAPELHGRAACSTNACLSALTTSTAVARPDCISYLATTVTPCSKTVKTTITLTSTTGCPFKGSTVVTTSTTSACPVSKTASSIPAYASACDAAGYSSACGCINGKAAKTTLPAGTITATVYKTVQAAPSFSVKAVSAMYNGYWLNSGSNGEGSNTGYLQFAQDRSSAEQYIYKNKTVYGAQGTQAWSGDGEGCHGCYSPTYETSDLNPQYTLACSLGSTLKGDGYLDLTCKSPQGGSVFQTCSPDGRSLDLGGSPEREFFDCFVAKLGAYPACPA